MAYNSLVNHKIIILSAISLALAALFGFFFVDFVLKANLWSLLWALVIGIVYLSLLFIKTTLIKPIWGDLVSITIDILIISAFFWGNYNLWLWLAALITILGLWGTTALVQSIVNNSVKIRLNELGRHFFRPAFLALSFFVIAVYLSFVNPQNISVPRVWTDYLIDTTYQTVPIKPTVDPALLKDYLHTNLNFTLQTLPETLKTSFLILAGLVVLSLVNSLAFIVSWLGYLLSFLIFRLLLVIKFVTIKTVKVDKELIA